MKVTEKKMSKNGLVMKYFVLKPDGDDTYAEASRSALRAYATVIREENPELAADLDEWLLKIERSNDE